MDQLAEVAGCWAIAPTGLVAEFHAVAGQHRMNLIGRDLDKGFDNSFDAGRDYRRPGIPVRPVQRGMRLRQVMRVPRRLTDAQVEMLLEAMTSQHDLAMLLLMLQGGLRSGGGFDPSLRRRREWSTSGHPALSSRSSQGRTRQVAVGARRRSV
ncbi:MAG: hypothetical protein ACR2QH_05795 [Geminicoccaceae bacterium]